MIIDLILDRKDGMTYNAEDFYRDIIDYENIFELSHDISLAMDYGNNEDVQQALCSYIDNQHYNPEIKQYICSVNWIISDTSEHDYTNTKHCEKCVKCSVIALQEINNFDLARHIEKRTKEIFPDTFMQAIQNNLSANIGKLIDNI